MLMEHMLLLFLCAIYIPHKYTQQKAKGAKEREGHTHTRTIHAPWK